jgi:hypothetical protein
MRFELKSIVFSERMSEETNETHSYFVTVGGTVKQRPNEVPEDERSYYRMIL